MTATDKLVGIIGGMGPDATVDFMSQILQVTPATTDQDHVHMVVENNPRIPSRQAAMRGEGQSPGPAIAAIAARLEAMGAEFLVMPCNLAHAWQSDIEAAITIPFISIVEESVRSALQRSGDDSAVGLMTTPGCFTAGLYQQALAESGRPVIMQTPEELAEAMSLVEQIKSGNRSQQIASGLRALANKLVDRGAKVLIAACTEFPLVLDESMFDVAFVSSTDVLARKTVAIALGKDELQ
jgi:aspartate racemase